PRAWGRPVAATLTGRVGGNTPTGVGKTHSAAHSLGRVWKHPHGRGEDSGQAAGDPSALETPPRAWGRPHRPPRTVPPSRNTPTGVGKTFLWSLTSRRYRKHPHGRGEDHHTPAHTPPPLETPPRAWGRPLRSEVATVASGNT